MSRSHRIHTVADAKRDAGPRPAPCLPPSTLDGLSFDVPLGAHEGVVTRVVGAADLADKVRRARLRLAGA